MCDKYEWTSFHDGCFLVAFAVRSSAFWRWLCRFVALLRDGAAGQKFPTFIFRLLAECRASTEDRATLRYERREPSIWPNALIKRLFLVLGAAQMRSGSAISPSECVET